MAPSCGDRIYLQFPVSADQQTISGGRWCHRDESTLHFKTIFQEVGAFWGGTNQKPFPGHLWDKQTTLQSHWGYRDNV